MKGRRFLTVEELAEEWRTTPAAIYSMRYRREAPPAYRRGRRLLFDADQAAAWLESQRDVAPGGNRGRHELDHVHRSATTRTRERDEL